MYVTPLITETMKANHQQKIKRIEEHYTMHNRPLAD